MTDSPVPNRADDQRIRRNRNTHQWMTLDNEDWSCLVCDCKDWHVAAEYPCGQEPPRTSGRIPVGKVPFETDGTGIVDDAYDWDEPDPHDWGRTP